MLYSLTTILRSKTKLDMQKVKQQVTLLAELSLVRFRTLTGHHLPFRSSVTDAEWTGMLAPPQDKPSLTGFA